MHYLVIRILAFTVNKIGMREEYVMIRPIIVFAVTIIFVEISLLIVKKLELSRKVQ